MTSLLRPVVELLLPCSNLDSFTEAYLFCHRHHHQPEAFLFCHICRYQLSFFVWISYYSTHRHHHQPKASTIYDGCRCRCLLKFLTPRRSPKIQQITTKHLLQRSLMVVVDRLLGTYKDSQTIPREAMICHHGK